MGSGPASTPKAVHRSQFTDNREPPDPSHPGWKPSLGEDRPPLREDRPPAIPEVEKLGTAKG
jgi:hypothetical protein